MVKKDKQNRRRVLGRKKPAAKLKKIKFAFDSHDAENVNLAGDFNEWDAGSLPLRRNRKKAWEKSVALKPGRYEYKFVVDGSWISDPKNDSRVMNSFGSENSVIEVKG